MLKTRKRNMQLARGRSRGVTLVCLMIAGLLTFANAHPAASQDTGLVSNESYVSKFTATEITWESDWAYDTQLSDAYDQAEFIVLTSETAKVLITYVPSDLNPEATLDSLLTTIVSENVELQLVDRDWMATVPYSLDVATAGDDAMGLFSLVRTGDSAWMRFVTIIAPIPAFATSMMSAQEQIELGGIPAFEGIVADGLQAQLEQQSDPSGAEDPFIEDPAKNPDLRDELGDG